MDSTNIKSESPMPGDKSPGELLPLLADTVIGVSHELNNCIGIVLGNVQLLRLKDDHAESEENYNRIEKSLYHGASLIRQIQKFAEKSGKTPATSLEMSKLVSKAVETDESDWKTLASGKNLTVLTDLPECKLFVKADKRDLITAISQLIKNAVEHAPPDSEVSIILRIEGTRCKVIVVDSGQGIPAAFRHKIYEPFFSSKQEAGAGLGLTVVQSIVLRHGGRVSFSSNKESGTKFTLSFPLERIDDERIFTADSYKSRISNVLVVDDDIEICRVLCDILQLEGIETTACRSAYAALEAMQESTFQLVITDWAMPGMSGYELITEIQGNYPDVQVVLITGWGSELVEKQYQLSGLKAVIAKPFSLNDILALVDVEQNE